MESEPGKEYSRFSSLLPFHSPLTKEYQLEGMGANFSVHTHTGVLGHKAGWAVEESGGAGRSFWHSTEMKMLISRDTEMRAPSNTHLMVRCQNMAQRWGRCLLSISVRMWMKETEASPQPLRAGKLGSAGKRHPRHEYQLRQKLNVTVLSGFSSCVYQQEGPRRKTGSGYF